MKSFPIVIKDYLPDKDIDLYKQYRLNELSSLPRNRSNNTEERPRHEFSSRTRVEYKHESKLLLKQLKNHPFIVHAFICDHHPKRDLRIFMEYLPHGNLHTYLRQLESDSQDSLINAFHWIYQLAQVMAYLSNKKIVHRDLAVRNILLKNEKYIKLSDFGLSRLEGVELEGKDCIIPSRWVAPECFDRHATISSSSDIWSFGIVIWEIYSFGATPYEAETGNSSQPLVPLLKRFLIEQNRRLSRPDYCPESMYDLLYRCWNGNVSRRPRFVDIINEFNGTSIVKDCIVPFTREERKLWRRAKDEYFLINQSLRNLSNIDPEYVEVEDNENDATVASEI
jgi:serine/threonine protein kinase